MWTDFLFNWSKMKAGLDSGTMTPTGHRRDTLTSPIKPQTPCGPEERGFTLLLGPNLSLQVSDFMLEKVGGFVT